MSGKLDHIMDRLDDLEENQMTTADDIAAVSATLLDVSGQLADIDSSTTANAEATAATQAAVDAIQQWVADHPDIDPALAGLAAQAAQLAGDSATTAQAASDAATAAASLASDAASTFPAAPPVEEPPSGEAPG